VSLCAFCAASENINLAFSLRKALLATNEYEERDEQQILLKLN
jgi:hypothetical protein